MSFARIQQALEAFFKEHPDETFYVIAIDAGYLYLNSEEEHAKRCTHYSLLWEEKTRPVTAKEVRACPRAKVDDRYPSFAFRRGDGESFASAFQVETESRAKQRAKGNPYLVPESREHQRLRYGTGNMTYSQEINLHLDREYQAHYETEDADKPSTPYAKKVTEILAALEAHKATFLAGVKVSPEFRIYAVEHEL